MTTKPIHLNERLIKEIAQLFPVVMARYNQKWTTLIKAEKEYETLWDSIYIKDYWQQNENEAKKYEAIKPALPMQFELDSEVYAKGKDESVNRITKLAKHHYG